ncbi:hypothetical protein MGLY_33320 [Neomoorella glycerini]|uniref:Serine dehydratase-like alpha subunit domain-containing protein n=1 Tax=Neomoorella glycerini TaxID=55779 RepID=A0A6I5ZWF4_9FIRM|nr:L-serine ammonia-lyase, iron-sulfur-dependent, subunit alpha [Moorella glycerini]QGP93908.1 hypothetical protein MGLY_33320 [Moorella glycerini]
MLDQRALVNLLHQEADLAIGCTEPVMVAMAAARARQVLGVLPEQVEVVVSPAVWKNGRRVGLPGTRERGLDMAAAMGLLAPLEEGQRLLAFLEPGQITQAKKLVLEGAVKARVLLNKEGLYTGVWARAGNNEVRVEMQDNHKNFSGVWKNGKLIDKPGEQFNLSLKALLKQDYPSLLAAVLTLPGQEIDFLYQGARGIVIFAREVAEGIKVPGSSLSRFFRRAGAKTGAPAEQIRTLTGIAVAERMSGAVYPVLTSAGSGNQGILIAVPLFLVGEALETKRELLSRALAVAHYTNMYLRAYSGKLSPLCGAVTAGAGVAAAVSWLLGGSRQQMINAAQILLGNLCCVLCDGAKENCSLKISTAAVEAVQAGQMAHLGINPEAGAGIIGKSLEDTLGLIKTVLQIGMDEVDYYLGKIDYLNLG